MPHTLLYRPVLIDQLISNDRISSYQSVFGAHSDVDLIGAYLWNAHVCASMYPLISAAEVTLRNAIDYALKRRLGTFWWKPAKLHYKSFSLGGPEPKVVTNLKKNFVSATDKYRWDQSSKGKSPAPNHAGIIAKTDFSTWEFILNDEFEGNSLIWPANLGLVFTGTWINNSGSQTLNHARDLISTIRLFRNRMFHNEPAWKRYNVLTEADALSHLHEKLGKIESLIELIHPEKLRLLKLNGMFDVAKRVCSSDEIRRFQHRSVTKNITSIRKLKEIVELSSFENNVYQAKVTGRKKYFLISPKY